MYIFLGPAENEIDSKSFDDCTEEDIKSMVKKIGTTKKLMRLNQVSITDIYVPSVKLP